MENCSSSRNNLRLAGLFREALRVARAIVRGSSVRRNNGVDLANAFLNILNSRKSVISGGDVSVVQNRAVLLVAKMHRIILTSCVAA